VLHLPTCPLVHPSIHLSVCHVRRAQWCTAGACDEEFWDLSVSELHDEADPSLCRAGACYSAAGVRDDEVQNLSVSQPCVGYDNTEWIYVRRPAGQTPAPGPRDWGDVPLGRPQHLRGGVMIMGGGGEAREHGGGDGGIGEGMAPIGAGASMWDGTAASRRLLHGGACADGQASGLVKLPLGSLRVSLGYMSRFEDVAAFVAFLNETFVDSSGSGWSGG
jgi:hypothetical protein